MGQAKNRGTFEERKKQAIERDEKLFLAKREIELRKPSPKHAQLIGIMAAMSMSRRRSFLTQP